MMENESGTVFVTEASSPKEQLPTVKNLSASLSGEVEKLLKGYDGIFKNQDHYNDVPKVKVGSSLSSLAFFYERLRNMIDYKGDHTILRNAIERIAKRQLWENPAKAMDTDRLAEDLIKELIWARYIKNNTFPQHEIADISAVFSKSLKILYLLSSQSLGPGFGIKWNNWIMGIASAQIEEVIRPSLKSNTNMADAVADWFMGKYDWQDSALEEPEKRMQVQIAVHRGLYKSDLASVRYYLIKKLLPEWFLTQEHIEDLVKELIVKAVEIEKSLNHKIQIRIFRFVQKQVPPFLILSEILESGGGASLVFDQESLNKSISEVCDKNYSETQSRISRGITRSIIYIFATKIIFALIIEIPYDLMVDGAVRLIPMGINLTFPPVLMWFLGLMIRKPDVKNTQKIIEVIDDFVYNSESEKIEFSLMEKSKKGFMYRFFIYLYMALFVVVFGLIAYLLFRLHFSVISSLIFFGFLSLVLLFGFRVKHNSSQLNVVETDEGALSNIISIVSLPFLNVGVWLSSQLAKINFLLLIFDFLIEAPLKNILSVLEEWGIFIREKKDEIIEVPSSN